MEPWIVTHTGDYAGLLAALEGVEGVRALRELPRRQAVVLAEVGAAARLAKLPEVLAVVPDAVQHLHSRDV